MSQSIRQKIAERLLSIEKGGQKETFNRLSPSFKRKYRELAKHDISGFTTPLWEEFNTGLEKVFLPFPPINFLQNETIKHTMFVGSGGIWPPDEQAFLEEHVDRATLKNILREDLIGKPSLGVPKLRTSFNSIHHLYHLERYKAAVSHYDPSIVLEWGGGYGNLAKLLWRGGATDTYILVDTPLFSALQWLYLSSVLGEENVSLWTNKRGRLQEGKVNIVSLPFVGGLSGLTTSLFVSTWALSESSPYSQDYVFSRNWFGAKGLLLAYQKSFEDLPNAANVGKIAQKDRASIEEISFLPGNYYAFR